MSYRILLLSAYDAMSHKMWRSRLLEMFPEHKWTQLCLPPRQFNWRIRGNSLQWALTERELLERDYDLVLATSMVDLASLRGFIPKLAQIPSILYFHENQFVYPVGSEARNSNIEPQLVPLYSTLCADAIVFNSEYNRSTFLRGAEELLGRLPDRLPASLLERITDSEVIPVPLEDLPSLTEEPMEKPAAETLELVWNHRWEYDKGPKLLLRLAETLLRDRLPIRLHVLGQRFRSSPTEFAQIDSLLQQHSTQMALQRGRFGFIESRRDYLDLLQRCDVVLSTALHDFQGLSIQEACALGCTPLVPDALVYPEYIPDEFRYRFEMRGEDENNEQGDESCSNLTRKLQQWLEIERAGIQLPKIALGKFSQEKLSPKYSQLFNRLIEAK